MITLESNIAGVNAALARQAELTGKTMREVLASEAGWVIRTIASNLNQLTPVKGSIRAERLAALKRGSVPIIRPGLAEIVARRYHLATDLSSKQQVFIRGKRNKAVSSIRRKGKPMNLQALVIERELNLRERGRGYTSYAARLRWVETLDVQATTLSHYGRYRQLLTTAEMESMPGSAALTFTFGGAGVEIGESLSTAAAQQAIADGVDRYAARANIYADKLAARMQSGIDRA